jgi:hypothetical protein
MVIQGGMAVWDGWRMQFSARFLILKWKSSKQTYVNKRFVYILNCCIFLKYDVLSEYENI